MTDEKIEDIGKTDRDDWECFLSELAITNEQVWALTIAGNQCKKPMQGVEVRESGIQGLGLFTTSKIKANTVIGVALRNGVKTHAGRYVNHSPNPNTKLIVRDMANIDLVAIRDIDEGEEITTNYRETLKNRVETLGRSHTDDLEWAVHWHEALGKARQEKVCSSNAVGTDLRR